MKIEELNPADFGGAIAHVAASQLFTFLTQDDDDEAGARVWFSGAAPDDPAVEKDVLDMARYINGRTIPAEQLWRWGRIQGIVVPAGEDFATLPLARRMAFEIFTDVCAGAHHRLELAQLDQRKAEVAAVAAEPVTGLKLEDSIFEPHGSLSDQEAYQAQWLKDQETLDRKRLEEQQHIEEKADAFSAGAPVGENQEPEKPVSMSVGTQEGAGREKEATDQGPGAIVEAPADPDAQGDVSDLADDDGNQSAAGEGMGKAGEQSEQDPPPAPVAAPVADAGAGESGDGDPADKPVEEPAKPKKTTKSKSPD